MNEAGNRDVDKRESPGVDDAGLGAMMRMRARGQDVDDEGARMRMKSGIDVYEAESQDVYKKAGSMDVNEAGRGFGSGQEVDYAGARAGPRFGYVGCG